MSRVLDEAREEIAFFRNQTFYDKKGGKIEDINKRLNKIEKVANYFERVCETIDLLVDHKELVAKDFEEWCSDNDCKLDDTEKLIEWLLKAEFRRFLIL